MRLTHNPAATTTNVSPPLAKSLALNQYAPLIFATLFSTAVQLPQPDQLQGAQGLCKGGLDGRGRSGEEG